MSFAKSRNGGEYDPSKFMSVKEVWVNQQMDQRSSEFTDYKPLRYRAHILLPRTRHTTRRHRTHDTQRLCGLPSLVGCVRFMFGTWNVNGKMPESLDGWLRTDQPPPDLYAIGYTPKPLTKACGCDSHHIFLID